MINIGPGAYIHCYEYTSPTIAAVKAVQYAPYRPENDPRITSTTITRVPCGTLVPFKNGEKTNGSE